MVNAVKVFKKSAPNGKITVYLGRRDFIDNTVTTEPVDGVVLVDNDYLQSRKVFASVTVTYRFGREEDEVMGLHFSKEMNLTAQQIYPASEKRGPTEVQDKLVKKLGANAFPFAVLLPDTAPSSVQLQPFGDTIKPLGVIYELRVYVADTAEDRPHKRNSVNLAVRKVQYSPVERSCRQPSTLFSKGFTLSSGKLNLEVSLDREIYYHGEQITAHLHINNASKKTVKNIKCSVVQHVEVTMTNSHLTREVVCLESKEGCPITPGYSLHRSFHLTPLATSNKTRGGVALDGKFRDSDANLASSTIIGAGQNPNDLLGIIVSYSVRVRLNCGSIVGELLADLPFKLMHPAPAGILSADKEGEDKLNEDNIVFEDFARLRRGMSVDQRGISVDQS